MNHALFELPGPRRFVRRLERRIELGATSTVVLPRAAAPAGLRRAVLPRAFDDQVRSVRLSTLGAEGTGPMAMRLADAIDITRPVGARVDVTFLATATSLGRRVIWLEADARTAPDLVAEWLELAAQFAQATKNVPVVDRPTLVTVLTGHHLANVFDVDDVDVIWWWAVLDRLDTAVHVANGVYAQTTVSPDLEAMIVELAGHDLGLADTLTETWRGDADHACELLAKHAEQRGWQAAIAFGSAGSQRPPIDGLESWHAGSLESWRPDRPGSHVSCDPSLERAVNGRIWRAQIRTVYPRIEELRQELAAWVATHAVHLSAYWNETDPLDLEISSLKDAIEATGVLRTDRARRDAARWAARVRNELAHVRPISVGELEEGSRLLTVASTLL